jgi:hypothetical protein
MVWVIACEMAMLHKTFFHVAAKCEGDLFIKAHADASVVRLFLTVEWFKLLLLSAYL